MYDGIINVYKEKGFTSFDVVAKMRGILGQKKVGHTGTLDPEAEGVLPVCVGKGTRLCDMLTDRDKTYEATLLLGMETDTQDTTGTVLSETDASGLTEEAVREAVLCFVGDYDQIPPMYSALKVNGRKLCDLARQGVEVERKPRPVKIYDITIRSIRLPEVVMTVSCSKGTYIRTLCHDIGEKLAVGGCMKKLLRTRAAGFRMEDSRTLDELQALKDTGRLEEAVLPVDPALESAITGEDTSLKQKTCPVCGRSYLPTTSQAYCSDSCRAFARRKSERERKRRSRKN
jgi:tRNA pseudouridine55 synthase